MKNLSIEIYYDGIDIKNNNSDNIKGFTTNISFLKQANIRDYTKFNVKNEGWADVKYDAEITLVINDQDQLPIVKPKTNATTLADSVKTIITPFFNARTANFEEAMNSNFNLEST